MTEEARAVICRHYDVDCWYQRYCSAVFCNDLICDSYEAVT